MKLIALVKYRFAASAIFCTSLNYFSLIGLLIILSVAFTILIILNIIYIVWSIAYIYESIYWRRSESYAAYVISYVYCMRSFGVFSVFIVLSMLNASRICYDDRVMLSTKRSLSFSHVKLRSIGCLLSVFESPSSITTSGLIEVSVGKCVNHALKSYITVYE